MPLSDRNIAFTDLETTGLIASRHEIIEMGVVITNSKLEIIKEIDVKILPEHIETASAESLEFNGYKKENWLDAVNLRAALEMYSRETANAIFAAHNPAFDWSFIEQAFYKTGVVDQTDYHRIDNFSIAWKVLRNTGLQNMGQDDLAVHFGLDPEPMPHRAINGARMALEVYKHLMEL